MGFIGSTCTALPREETRRHGTGAHALQHPSCSGASCIRYQKLNVVYHTLVSSADFQTVLSWVSQGQSALPYQAVMRRTLRQRTAAAAQPENAQARLRARNRLAARRRMLRRVIASSL